MTNLDPANHPHFNGFALLPPKSGTCPECAVEHDPANCHNQQSMYWQYNFYGKHKRWPTWKDAMAHCTDDVKAQWVKLLAEHGVKV